jgi:hypothetical protein
MFMNDSHCQTKGQFLLKKGTLPLVYDMCEGKLAVKSRKFEGRQGQKGGHDGSCFLFFVLPNPALV